MTIQFLKLSKDKILTASVVSMVVVFTFVTTGMAAVKIVKNSSNLALLDDNQKSVVSQSKTNKKSGFWDLIQQKLNLDDRETENQNTDDTITSQNTTKSNLTSLTSTPKSTTNSSSSQSSGSNQCIVSVFGRQYDVTNLIRTHSGGNIFNCGTDMSSIYQGKHGSNVSLIQAYLYNSGGNTSTQPTPTPLMSTPTPAPTTDSNRCIVTVFSKQYDVTSLRSSHSGGNIFNCNTDMSSIYQSKHGSNISLIQAYLYNSGGGTTNPTPTPTPTPTPSTQPSSTPTNNPNQCIVTVFSKQYDVTNLVRTHSGPRNIFNCGTDISSTYQSKHGTNVSLIQRYLYTGTVTPPSGQTTPQPTSTPRSRHRDDDDD